MTELPDRRRFLASSAALLAGAGCRAHPPAARVDPPAREPIIDIHQHVPYSGRTEEQLVAHQERMGVTQTVLLPAGTPVERPSTHMGRSNGLAARVAGSAAAMAMARKFRGRYCFFGNEVADLPGATDEIERCLEQGARGIGEVKFNVDCDSSYIEAIALLAGAYDVPVLLHFQHQTYNLGYERFHRVLEKFPRVAFIGHAQTFWANIDKNAVQTDLYPKTPVTPGGLTDRYLADYPNMYADTSAGSGLNALLRDEGHARAFLARHQDKILFGSDCPDPSGAGSECHGAKILAALRRLAPSKEVERKILHQNARRLLRL